MFVAGVDIGSRAAKAVVMRDGQIVSHAIIDTGADSARTAEEVLHEGVSPVGLNVDNVRYVVGAGRTARPSAATPAAGWSAS